MLLSSRCPLDFSQQPTISSSLPTFHRPISPKSNKICRTVAAKSLNQSSSVLSFLCPLLKFFSVSLPAESIWNSHTPNFHPVFIQTSDPSQERNNFLEVTTSSLSTLARLPWGSSSIAAKDLPMRLQLFEFEACPFCRRVREAMTELDLSVEVYPCPKGSRRHREIVKQLGGKEQYPFLLDPNSEVSMYESGDIVKYLFEKYGQKRSPSVGLLESTLFTGWVPTILRAGRGMSLWEKSRKEPPPQKLELFSYENNPYARIVREALCELELPYILHNVGNGSQRSKLLLETSGSKEVPYLIDPNNDKQLGDYREIVSYLFQTYSTAT